jgi:hypothetical protein
LAEFLDLRQKRKTVIFERVEQAIEQNLSAETPAETPQSPMPAEMPVQTAPAINLHPEIKVVPHPEGPPVPVIENELDETQQHASPTEKIEVVAQTFAPAEPLVEPPIVNAVVPPAPPVSPPKPAPRVVEVAPQASPKSASIAEKAQQTAKATSLHQRLAAKNLSFGLNDRIAYVKHLFDGSTDDFNRVVNQLNTFESWGEAEEFIAEMVKPDYNWAGKEQYEERFVAQVKTRFET